MMYTTEPFDLIFSAGSENIKTIQLEFGVIEAEENGGVMRVRRVMSTRLSDYLDPRLAPGNEIKSTFRL